MNEICNLGPNHSATHAHGWGGRIRTCDTLIQSQMPYRLATPQNLVDSLGFEPRTYRLKVGCSEPAELRVHGGEVWLRSTPG